VVILLVCALQAGLLGWLSPGGGPQPARTRAGIEVRVKSAAPGAALNPERLDPTIFALVTSQGFSGSAWIGVTPFPYAPTNQSVPFQTLALPVEELAADFAEFVRTNLVADELALDSVPPARSELRLPEPVVIPAATVRVDGELAGRPLLPGAKLSPFGEPILTNLTTVVQVLVNRTGQTLSAALLSSCGVSKADQEALRFAATARFAPAALSADAEVQEEAMVFGTLTFQWAGVRWETPRPVAAQSAAP
jgi:TonB family protein